MLIFNQPEEIRSQCAAWRQAGKKIALVPTMGYYHAGHESLMEEGRKLGDKLVVSLFVNPAQFGPNEDLAAYPRDFARDCEIAENHGVDALFAPEPDAMYSKLHGTWVETPELAKGLCGRSRPVHFRGVCTVVLKLLNLVTPDYAIFGQKDWQQQAIIKRMAEDLNIASKILAMPIVREQDGLALSSRNVYLNDSQRRHAPLIYQGLRLAHELAMAGETSASVLCSAVQNYWKANMPEAKVDYISVIDPDTLAPVDAISGSALMACAVFLGKTRLIDNLLLTE